MSKLTRREALSSMFATVAAVGLPTTPLTLCAALKGPHRVEKVLPFERLLIEMDQEPDPRDMQDPLSFLLPFKWLMLRKGEIRYTAIDGKIIAGHIAYKSLWSRKYALGWFHGVSEFACDAECPRAACMLTYEEDDDEPGELRIAHDEVFEINTARLASCPLDSFSEQISAYFPGHIRGGPGAINFNEAAFKPFKMAAGQQQHFYDRKARGNSVITA